VLKAAIDGHNVFITGSAGVGKSYIMKRVIKDLLEQKKNVGVTASTGIAAINIGGVTIYRYFRIAPNMLKESSIPERTEWKTTDVLIIDEISMIIPELFIYLDKQARKSRGCDKPFGGIQIIAVGDFSQIPPVMKKVKYVFELPLWHSTFKKIIQLTDIFRQTEVKFITLLEHMRIGKITDQDKQLLHQLNRPLPKSDIIPTKLYCKNRAVNIENATYLNKLPTREYVYDCAIRCNTREMSGNEHTYLHDNIDKFIPVAKKIHLKLNAQVMLVVNLTDTLANGSRGVICGFTDENNFPIVKFLNNRVVIRPYIRTVKVSTTLTVDFIFVPLRLAWAITIHKSQGQSIDRLQIYCKDIFQSGQAYTAISRGTSLQNLQLIGFQDSHLKVDDRVIEYYKSIQ
jgi:ATP-dependent DNA helicase PIF1